MIEAIFGRQRTWQRRACIVLCLVTTGLGIGLMVVGDDPAEGAMIAVVGIIAGVLLARMVEETTKRATTSAILGDIARMGATTPMGTAGSGRGPSLPEDVPSGGGDPADGGDAAHAPPDESGAEHDGPGSHGGAPSSNGRVD